MNNKELKSKRNEIYNPFWLQCVFYIGVIGIASLSVYMLSLSFQGLQLNEIEKLAAIPFLVLSIWLAYITGVGFKLLKFVPAKLYFDDNGFEVDLLHEAKWYAWSDIGTVKNNTYTQVLRLYDAEGTIIYMVDHMSPGYSDFAIKLHNAIAMQ